MDDVTLKTIAYIQENLDDQNPLLITMMAKNGMRILVNAFREYESDLTALRSELSEAKDLNEELVGAWDTYGDGETCVAALCDNECDDCLLFKAMHKAKKLQGPK